jgi:G3E family GTPase
MTDSSDPIPATVLSGSLGAGKTTIVNHLLSETDRRLAVVVNDVGELNVDRELVERRIDLANSESEVYGLESGCICCGLQGEFENELYRLAYDLAFDHLLVESSGISEPAPIARNLAQPGPVGDLYEIDAMVTVVDTPRFLDAFGSESVPERSGPGEEGTRPLSDLTIEQVEFCDVLVSNKCDLLSEVEVEQAERLLRALQPDATLHWTEFGRIEVEKLIGTGRFDLERVRGSAGWKRAIEHHEAHADGHDHDHDDTGDHDPETHEEGHSHGHDHHDHHDHRHPPEAYGIDSFLYHGTRPFHPERLLDWLREPPAGIVRWKGLLWVAGRHRQGFDLSGAGEQVRVSINGRWVATLPAFQREAYRERNPTMHWDEEWGDRENKLVFIGTDYDDRSITDALDDCLLTDQEMETDWGAFENEFPRRPAEELVVDPEGSELVPGAD